MRPGAIPYEVYEGPAPERRARALECRCSGRCEPEGVEPGIGHSARCAKKLNSYASPNAGSGEYKFAICSPCLRRMLDVGVDIPKLMPPRDMTEEPEALELPMLQYWRKERRYGVEKLAEISAVPVEHIRRAEEGEEIDAIEAHALAYALRIYLNRLRGTYAGRGGRAPGALLEGLQREMDARGIAPKTLGLKAHLNGRDHVYKLRQLKRRAYPEQVAAIAKVLGCEEKDLLK